jgi:Ser/Thr protein kinase RdoA (MazF antagonist)
MGLSGGAQAVALAGSMSSSGVYRVRLAGRDAVLKVSEGEPAQRIEARRELRFYRDLAESIPLSTPQLLADADSEELTAMLLSVHRAAAPARTWARSEWLEAARQLAVLHSFEAPRRDPWIHAPWVRGVLDDPPAGMAIDHWSRTPAAGRAADLLDDPAALARALDAGPAGFIHGDCHVDNLLRDGDRLVWADWQAAGVGTCGIDLAFLFGRAYADGADPPVEAMVDEYVARRDVDPALLRRSMMAAELATLLFGWPAYMDHHTLYERDRITARLVQLAGDWLS